MSYTVHTFLHNSHVFNLPKPCSFYYISTVKFPLVVLGAVHYRKEDHLYSSIIIANRDLDRDTRALN